MSISSPKKTSRKYTRKERDLFQLTCWRLWPKCLSSCAMWLLPKCRLPVPRYLIWDEAERSLFWPADCSNIHYSLKFNPLKLLHLCHKPCMYFTFGMGWFPFDWASNCHVDGRMQQLGASVPWLAKCCCTIGRTDHCSKDCWVLWWF